MRRFDSLTEIRREISAGTLSCKQLVGYYLGRIEENRHLNAFLEVWGEEALRRAEAVDQRLKEGTSGSLAGMVIALKDNICYKGHKVSGSSRILEGFESLYSSTVVERLLREDVIFIGRTNCDEFAMGASNENSAYGNVLNAMDTTRVPGGSSGGSAVAVQGDLCLAALGSDTGGSIRQPAAFTGTIGFKPTYGMVSRYGLIAYASSFDQIGPITRSVEDASRIMQVIAGPDDFDATMAQHQAPDFSLKAGDGKFKIAYLRDCVDGEGVDPRISSGIHKVLGQLKSEGHEVQAVEFPYVDYLVPCYYVLTTAEASSNLSRYQGLQYGYRSPNATDLESTFKKSRSEGFGAEVKRRIMLGTFVLSSGYYDAYYNKGQQVRQFIRMKTEEIFASFDFIILPTAPGIAFKVGEKAANPLAMYLADIFTVQANLAGNTAISIPGEGLIDNMPWGLQVMAPRFEDGKLLSFCHQLKENKAAHV